MNEIFVLSRMDHPVVAELRALGVKVHFRSEVGRIGITTIMRGSSDWTRELHRQVEEVLARHDLRELREGVWGPSETDAESLRRWEESARATQQYRDIWRTMTSHPDWTDQEIADACGADANDVRDYRENWELSEPGF